MDPNYDPRDETHSRPQVAFRLRADAYDTGEFFRDLTRRVPTCHDLMVFDAKNGEVPGTIRFEWDAPTTEVDRAADYLRSLPFVLAVFPGLRSSHRRGLTRRCSRQAREAGEG